MWQCLGFVFGVMIEFTIVNYLARRKIKPKELMEAAQKRTAAARSLISHAHSFFKLSQDD